MLALNFSVHGHSAEAVFVNLTMNQEIVVVCRLYSGLGPVRRSSKVPFSNHDKTLVLIGALESIIVTLELKLLTQGHCWSWSKRCGSFK